MKKIVFALALVLMSTLAVQAFDTTPLQISIWPSKFQIVPDNINVSGLKLNLPFGRNEKITGLDLGIASSSSETAAIQVNVLLNRAHEDFAGLQVGLINQSGNAGGIIVGGMNITDNTTKGLQIGIINSSMETRGMQIGLINYTEIMTGIQIGLVNIITESVIPFFPVINFCF